MKAVISAGGKGKRMYSLTRGEVPKSLLYAGEKPVIAYQFEQIALAGVSDVLVAVNTDGAAKQFLESFRTPKFPRLNYDITVYPGNNPLHAFADPLVRCYVTDEDFIWSYADMVPEGKVIPMLMEQYAKEMANYGTRHFSPFGRNESGGVKVSCKNLVDAATGLTVFLHPPFIIVEESAGILAEESKNPSPKMSVLLRRICDIDELYGVGPFHVANVNTPTDLRNLEIMLAERPDMFYTLINA